MRNPVRALLVLLVLFLVLLVVLSFLPNDRPVRTMEEDVTNTIVGGG